MEVSMTLKHYKSAFFDRDAVLKEMTKKEKKVFSKIGAFIMRRARKSLKKGKRKHLAGTPGGAPASHTEKLRKSVLFAWDSATRSVVVGPYLFGGGPTRPTVPELLEYGGRSSETGKTYHAFPYMRPAAAAELPKLPQMWRDADK